MQDLKVQYVLVTDTYPRECIAVESSEELKCRGKQKLLASKVVEMTLDAVAEDYKKPMIETQTRPKRSCTNKTAQCEEGVQRGGVCTPCIVTVR